MDGCVHMHVCVPGERICMYVGVSVYMYVQCICHVVLPFSLPLSPPPSPPHDQLLCAYLKDDYSLEGIRALYQPGTVLLLKIHYGKIKSNLSTCTYVCQL